MIQERKRVAPRHGRRRSHAMHLTDYLAILRNHLAVALVVFFVVTALLATRVLFRKPVYRSAATIKIDQPRGPNDLLGELMAADTTQTTDAEMEIMRSRHVARGAALDLEANVFLVERNAYRPLERLLADYGFLRRPPCHVEVKVARPGEGDPGGTYYFQFSRETGPGGVPRSIRMHEGHEDDPVDPTVIEGFESGKPFEAFGRTFTLRVAGAAAGRVFKLDLWPAERLANWIKPRVIVAEVGHRTGVISLGANAPTPELAQAVANAVANSYLRYKESQKKKTLNSAAGFLDKALAKVKRELDAMERELDEYRSRSGAMLLSERGKWLVTQIGTLEYQRAEFANTLAEQERLQAALDGENGVHNAVLALDGGQTDPVTSALATRLIDLESREDLLKLDHLSDQHPTAKRLMVELSNNRRRLRESVSSILASRIAGTRRRLDETRNALARFDREMKSLPLTERKLVELRRKVETQVQAYSYLTEKKQETSIALASTMSAAHLVDAAGPAGSRRSPLLFKEFLLALFFGFLAALGVAFAREYLDRSIKSPQELAEGVGVPLYAALPHFKSVKSRSLKKVKSALVAMDHPKSVLAENYRTLRANIRFANLESPLKTFAITSSLQGEGKTVTTLNLAVVLAQGGSKVVIVDADMRRPATHTHLGAALSPGFTDILTGKAAWREVIRDTSVPTLKAIHAGGKPSNPWALLDAPAFKTMLDELREEFDFILFDVPPVLAVADSASFFPALDGVFLLARYKGCSLDVALDARDQIERTGANLVGVLFNGFDARKAMRRGYGAYGYYGYYGRYGKYGGYGHGYGYGYGYGYGEEHRGHRRSRVKEQIAEVEEKQQV